MDEQHQKLESLKSQYKEISDIDSSDQDTFYSFIDKGDTNIASFENNWSYIVQATRGLGMKIMKYDTIIYFWLRNESELVIVNKLGSEYTKILSELNKVCATLKINITIKNIDTTEIENLKKIGFIIKDYPWSEYSFMDDNTFPQIVADIKGIVELKSSALRESHRLNIKRFLRKRNIEIQPYEQEMESVARQLLIDNSKYLEEKHVENKKEVYDAHVFFFEKDLKNVCRFVYKEQGDQIAFALFTVRKGVVYWNALMNKDESNLMLYLLWMGMKYIVEHIDRNATKLALQGCETEGQYKWKQGFYPLEVLEKIHMHSNNTKV